MKKSIRIGTGAGYSGDRIEPAAELAARGQLDYLVFECLAERTIALAQLRKKNDPESGFDPLLEERMRACLPDCHKNGVTIISNMGAANPVAAMHATTRIAKEMGLSDLKIAAVTGDDVLHLIKKGTYELLESKAPLQSLESNIISANAYLGAEGILKALQADADIILTGRVADPALFLAPMIYEFGWSLYQYDLLGKGITLGHLMECAGQVTGGYFAEPGLKYVPDLANLGFPIAEVSQDGSFFITKLPDTGGMVTTATCKEQLLYEIQDPSQYFTPDVVADFTKVKLESIGADQVVVKDGTGKKPTGLLKVSVGYKDGFWGEGQISYGGSGAVLRAQLALDIVKERLRQAGIDHEDARFEMIGLNSLYGNKIPDGTPFEVRIRVAAKTTDRATAIKIGNEVEALYTNGPAGGGGASKNVQEIIAIQSVLIDAGLIETEVHIIEI